MLTCTLPMHCSAMVQKNQQSEKSECVTDHCSYIVMDMGRAREAPRLQVQYNPVAAQCISSWSEWSYPILYWEQKFSAPPILFLPWSKKKVVYKMRPGWVFHWNALRGRLSWISVFSKCYFPSKETQHILLPNQYFLDGIFPHCPAQTQTEN